MKMLNAVLCVAVLVLGSCARLFQPDGEPHIPNTVEMEQTLRRHVQVLAEEIGERNHYHQAAYDKAAQYIADEFRRMGYEVERQSYRIPAREEYLSAAGKTAVNLEVRKPGTDPEAPWLVVGAHYDTRVGMPKWNCHGPVIPAKTGTPGANDNGSGVAALLALAEALRHVPTRHGIIFVAYANEEAPFFQQDEMGSRQHARKLVRELGKERILGMMTPETLGVYSPRLNKKRRSAVAGSLFGIPDRCDYVAFMSTNMGRDFARRCADVFTEQCRFPVRTINFAYMTRGVAWSDDWSYMKEGIPSFAITDTAYMRSDDYHETSDTPDKLDYREFAEVVLGLEKMLTTLANTR